MSRGESVGVATMSYGRCLINGHIPPFKRDSFTCSALSEATFFFPKSSYSCWASGFTTMLSTLRFSPRFTAVTSPLTGETNLISGRFLSVISTEPALTLSPTLATTFGVMPLKLSGTIAYVALLPPFSNASEALPFRLMSKPFLILITFAMI